MFLKVLAFDEKSEFVNFEAEVFMCYVRLLLCRVLNYWNDGDQDDNDVCFCGVGFVRCYCCAG